MWFTLILKKKKTYKGIGTGVLAEASFKLRVAGVGGLHHEIPDHTWNDTAYCSECKEEWL